jgi:tetratricopeptide (TPR) repeat protein
LLRQVINRTIGANPSAHQPETQEAMLTASRIYSRLAQIYLFFDRPIETLYACVRALNLIEQYSESSELANNYANMMITTGVVPIHPIARMYEHLADNVLNGLKNPNPANLTWIYEMKGLYYIGCGNWADSEIAFAKSIEIAETVGDLRHRDESSGLRYYNSVMHHGNFEAGKRIASELCNLALQRNDIQIHFINLSNRTLAMMYAGQIEESANSIHEISNLLKHNALGLSEKILGTGVISVIHLRQGNIDLAYQTAERAAQLVSKQALPSLVYTFEGYAAPAQVYLAMWEHYNSPVSVAAKRSCAALKKFAKSFAIAQPRASLYQGLYYWLKGKRSSAFKAWERGLSIARQLEMPYEEALLHYEIGRHMKHGELRRSEHLEQAVKTFERLGAVWDLSRAHYAVAVPPK